MGELKVGDVILSRDGTPTTVIFVTETMYDHDCYDVTFDNEEVVTADADHLWTIRWGDGERTLTTKELVLLNEYTEECVSGGIRLAIRTAKPVELPEIDLPIDPYILGVWLGDGYSAGPNLIASIEDFTHYQNEFNKRGYDLIEKRRNSTNTCIVGKIEPKDGRKFTHILRDLDLRDNKHIPNLYLRASKEQRLDLIRGLMDTDGYVDANGRCEFDQKKVDLANQTKELLCSLGVKVRHVVKVVNGEDYQKLRFATLEPICSLPRKVERLQKCYGHTR
jgi:intein/homing endonuclease